MDLAKSSLGKCFNQSESLSGIETQAAASSMTSTAVSTNLNPYQGLKLSSFFFLIGDCIRFNQSESLSGIETLQFEVGGILGWVSTNLNPYQGLKPILQGRERRRSQEFQPI